MSGPGESANDQEATGDQTEPWPGSEEEPETSQRRKFVLVAAGILVLVVAGVAAAVWSLQDDDDTGETVATEADGDDEDPTTDRSDDAAPEETPPPAPTDTTEPPAEPAPVEPAEPVEVATGSFVSLDYEVTGDVRLVEQADGSHSLRLENLASEDGPDLYVYLSTNPADGPAGAFKDDFADLGPLQALTGTQDYEVPADVDPGHFTSVVIWCEAVSAPFGAAALSS